MGIERGDERRMRKTTSNEFYDDFKQLNETYEIIMIKTKNSSTGQKRNLLLVSRCPELLIHPKIHASVLPSHTYTHIYKCIYGTNQFLDDW